MELNKLLRAIKENRVGRGIGSGRGKTLREDIKVKSRPELQQEFWGGQMPLFRRLPKRGFKTFSKNKTAILNLSKLQTICEKTKKNVIDLKSLKEEKFVNKKFLKLQILGTGDLKLKIDISANSASKQAEEKITKAGGKVNIIKK